MKTPRTPIVLVVLCIAAAMPTIPASAQTPPGYLSPSAPSAPLLSPEQLQDLVGRIALYPDDLIGLILPASTSPLDVVKAGRFLMAKEKNPSAKPDPSLPAPVTSLLNYPDVVTMMNDDLDWTQALGQAVTAQQADVLEAIQTFRRKAQSAGNLKSDDKQTIIIQQETIQIVPAQPEKIYVPVYQPATVVVAQPEPAVTYVPTAYPAYYYPGAAYVAGVATAYSIGWATGTVYHAPYPAHAAYYQDQRMDYANHAREDWQDYGTARREDWQDHMNDSQQQRQQNVSSNQAQRQQSLQETTSANQSQRQGAAADAQSTRQASRQAAMPQGAQSWQPQAGNRSYTRSSQTANRYQASYGNRASSSSGATSRQSASRSYSGSYGNMSSGSRASSHSQRGSRSMSSMQRSGGGRRRR